MERSISHFLQTYKWSVIGFLSMFIISLLFITLGFWAALIVILLSVVGTMVGYLKDSKMEFSTLLRNLK